MPCAFATSREHAALPHFRKSRVSNGSHRSARAVRASGGMPGGARPEGGPPRYGHHDGGGPIVTRIAQDGACLKRLTSVGPAAVDPSAHNENRRWLRRLARQVCDAGSGRVRSVGVLVVPRGGKVVLMVDEPAATERRTIAVPAELVGAVAKLTHGERHFDALGREIWSFLEQDQMDLASSHEDGWQVVRVASVPEPPLEWGVSLGDGLHDFRSALDNAVASLVRLAGGEPSRSNEFPILVDTPENRREKILSTALRGVLSAYQQPIREAQPYLSGEGRYRHPLAVLQSLSNADKHRLVHVATVRPADGEYRLRTTVGNEVVEQRQGPDMLTFAAGQELVRARVQPDVRGPIDVEFSFQVEAGFAVAEGQAPVCTMAQLADLYRYLLALLESLIPFFAGHHKAAVPADVLPQATSARIVLSHEHEGQRVAALPVGATERLTLPDGIRSYRRYVCPRCQRGSYAEIAGDIELF